MKEDKKFTLKAICFFNKDNKTLVSKGFDTVKKEHFYRALGGHVEFFETAENAVRREIREETGSEIENLKFISTIENLFIYQGQKNHEIVFMYSGDLVKKDLYGKESIRIVEETHQFDAYWVSIDEILSGTIPLYPEFNHKELFNHS